MVLYKTSFLLDHILGSSCKMPSFYVDLVFINSSQLFLCILKIEAVASLPDYIPGSLIKITPLDIFVFHLKMYLQLYTLLIIYLLLISLNLLRYILNRMKERQHLKLKNPTDNYFLIIGVQYTVFSTLLICLSKIKLLITHQDQKIQMFWSSIGLH